ncbi:MAG: S9 family peptidase [Bacteroidaceae bacterium]|nr:S9 family peptidase [Bacteroidaceae bacterium]
MKKIIFAVCSFLFASSIAVAETTELLNLKDITNGVYSPHHIYGVTPALDGETYTQLSSDYKKIIRRSFKTGEEVGVVFDVDQARGPVKLSHIDGYTMSPNEKRILLRTQTKGIYRHSYTAVHYIYDVASGTFEVLSNGGPQQVPLFSPDGNLIAFVRDNNLFLVKLLFGNAESQITKDGKFNHVLNGIPDWVYEEEFATSRSFDFSADSKMLAWIRYDETQVPIYSMTMYKGMAPTVASNDAYPGAYAYKYPVAGAENSQVKVFTFDISSRVTREMQVPLDADGYIPRIKFTSDPTKLAIVTLNRHQSVMNIYMGNPKSTVCKLAVQESNAEGKYIKEDAYSALTFFDGGFAMVSDRTDFRHIYLYNLNGQLLRQVTKGNFDICNFYGYDVKTGNCYYASHEESPLRKAIYVTDKKGKTKKLSTQVGTNQATFSKNFAYFMNVYSAINQPPVTTLCNAQGKTLKTLIDNASLKEKADKLCGQKELFSFTTADGVQLNGWMVKPRDFDASKQYPVIMYQYSGPGSQEVKDAWGLGMYGGAIYESYMAQQGFIFVCVDGRGTGGRGSQFEKCTYLRLGELESHDQVETAIYLGSLPYVDKDNIAIWGWSFGGFNTLMAMSEGRPVFKAGIAIAAPSNWKYYDTVYTERYMRTPQENADGYAVNPIQRSSKLHGNLLLIHGTADDNVHFRNFTEVAEAYVQADKQFDMHIYTNRNHSIYGGNTRYHLFNRMSNFFVEQLKK